MLKITREVIVGIIGHARRDAPLEACGYLGEKDDVVESFLPLTNTDASGEHFALDPAEQFAAVRDLRKRGQKLRGIYHSHPASPPGPSQEDIRLAFDRALSYVIVSLAEEPASVKSFRIMNGIAAEEEQIIV